MCRVGGRRCPSSRNPASSGVYTRRKSNREFRRDLATYVREEMGDPDLAKQVMKSSFTAIPHVVENLGLDPSKVSCREMPGQRQNHALRTSDKELIDRLGGHVPGDAEAVDDSILAASAEENKVLLGLREDVLAETVAADHRFALSETPYLSDAALRHRRGQAVRMLADAEERAAEHRKAGSAESAGIYEAEAERQRALLEAAEKVAEDRRNGTEPEPTPAEYARTTTTGALYAGIDADQAEYDRLRAEGHAAHKRGDHEEGLRLDNEAAYIKERKIAAAQAEIDARRFGTDRALPGRVAAMHGLGSDALDEKIADYEDNHEAIIEQAQLAALSGDTETSRNLLTDLGRMEAEAHSARAALHDRGSAARTALYDLDFAEKVTEGDAEELKRLRAELQPAAVSGDHEAKAKILALDMVERGVSPHDERARLLADAAQTDRLEELAAEAEAHAAELSGRDDLSPREKSSLAESSSMAAAMRAEASRRVAGHDRVTTDESRDLMQQAQAAYLADDPDTAGKALAEAERVERLAGARAKVHSNEDEQREVESDATIEELGRAAKLKNPNQSKKARSAVIEGEGIADEHRDRANHWRSLAEGESDPAVRDTYLTAAEGEDKRADNLIREVSRVDDRMLEDGTMHATKLGNVTRAQAVDAGREAVSGLTDRGVAQTSSDLYASAPDLIEKLQDAPWDAAEVVPEAVSHSEAAERLRQASAELRHIEDNRGGIEAVRSLARQDNREEQRKINADLDMSNFVPKQYGRLGTPGDVAQRYDKAAEVLTSPGTHTRPEVLDALELVPAVYDKHAADTDHAAVAESSRANQGRTYDTKALRLRTPLDNQNEVPEGYDSWEFGSKRGEPLGAPNAAMAVDTGSEAADILPDRAKEASHAFLEKIEDGTNTQARAAFSRKLGGALTAEEVEEMSRKAWRKVDDEITANEGAYGADLSPAQMAVTASIREEMADVRAAVKADPKKWPLLVNFVDRVAHGSDNVEGGTLTDALSRVEDGDLRAPQQEETLF